MRNNLLLLAISLVFLNVIQAQKLDIIPKPIKAMKIMIKGTNYEPIMTAQDLRINP